MPNRTRPMASLLLFTGLNIVLASTITPVYDFVCFLPYWERRRERRRLEREASSASGSVSSVGMHAVSPPLTDDTNWAVGTGMDVLGIAQLGNEIEKFASSA